MYQHLSVIGVQSRFFFCFPFYSNNGINLRAVSGIKSLSFTKSVSDPVRTRLRSVLGRTQTSRTIDTQGGKSRSSGVHLEALGHEIEEFIPGLKGVITEQSLQVLEEGLAPD